ncbi:hypothetical protein ABAC460_02370 [Asticcacaulis sp. AC460]|uniref:caspase family protein n=1 Tax=Asticcacaulis sp. AC460 TaxID=1282360 RepID=UPI0003C3BBC9|nr:caspase family protein [Asticcacaulis sp. AC460]ESQ92693.1 hypothetical protein ABAC460_02370 [Asticcacaulis sp. AC460]
MKLWLSLVAAFTLWCLGTVAHAAEPAKFALVINQVGYTHLTPLPDTDKEATQVTTALKQVGFDVTTVRNVNLSGLQTTLKDFRRKLAASPGAIGFIYYTGHGMADPTDEKGDNYLLGIDADVQVVADLPASGIKLSDLVNQMSRTDASAVIIVVDACRNTPSLGKAGTKGLVAVAAEPNTLVAYATDLGDIASVGVYAPVLAREIVKPGMSVTQVFDSVQIEVSKQTGRKQRPWSNNRIYDVICLAGCTVNINVTAPQVVTQPETVEQTFWASAKDCGDYRAYLNKYPNGEFAEMARTRLGAPLCNISRNPTSFDAGLAPALTSVSETLCDAKAGGQFDEDRPAGNNGYMAFASIVSAEAVPVCQQAVDSQPANRRMMVNLGRAYLAGSSFDLAQQWFQKAADAGSAQGMFQMAMMANRGGQDPSGDVAARPWLLSAAALGNAEAMEYVGIFYAYGRGGHPQDISLAKAWYEKAAAKNSPYSTAALGGMAFYGQAGDQDYIVARAWFKRAADMGYGPAMNSLGYMAEQGLMQPKDLNLARQWYEKAAAAGDPAGMTSLGTVYYNGTGVQQDYVKARQWFDAAARRGDVNAMANLGLMQQTGLGGPVDMSMARYWYDLAGKGGHAWAAQQLKSMPAG